MELGMEDLQSFLGQYPIVVKHVSKMGPNRYRIDGPFDLYEMYVVKKTSGLLRAFVSDYAAAHGFWRSQRLIRSFFGDPIVDIGHGQGICLVDWFDGTPLTPKGQDTIDVAQALARLHNALYGASLVIQSAKLFTPLPVLVDKAARFSQQLSVLEKFFAELNSKHVSNQFTRWVEEAFLRAKWLLPITQMGSIDAKKQLCWNISGFCDFIRFQNGRVGILQNGDPEFCDALFDLSILVSEVCIQEEKESVEVLIDAYREIAPLKMTDVNYVLADSAFPKAMIDYINQNSYLPDEGGDCDKFIQAFENEAHVAHRLMRMIRFPK